MLIKKLSFRPKDKEALEAFVKHVFPFVGDLSEEEKKLVKKFLEDPLEGTKKILGRVGSRELSLIKLEHNPKLEKPISGMILEYAKRKGWIKKLYEKEEFLWVNYLFVYMDEDLLPETEEDWRDLKWIKECLEELKERGIEKILKVKQTDERKICWHWGVLEIGRELLEEAERKGIVKKKEPRVEKVKKIVEWLISQPHKEREENKTERWEEREPWQLPGIVHVKDPRNNRNSRKNLEAIVGRMLWLKRHSLEEKVQCYSLNMKDKVCWFKSYIFVRKGGDFEKISFGEALGYVLHLAIVYGVRVEPKLTAPIYGGSRYITLPTGDKYDVEGAVLNNILEHFSSPDEEIILWRYMEDMSTRKANYFYRGCCWAEKLGIISFGSGGPRGGRTIELTTNGKLLWLYFYG